MNYSEIKIKLFQQIEALKDDRLIELYGVVSNFINNADNSEEWDKLTASQKKGLSPPVEKYSVKSLSPDKHQLVFVEPLSAISIMVQK